MYFKLFNHIFNIILDIKNNLQTIRVNHFLYNNSF